MYNIVLIGSYVMLCSGNAICRLLLNLLLQVRSFHELFLKEMVDLNSYWYLSYSTVFRSL